MIHSFPLAPMSPLIRGLTLGLWVLPPLFGIWALFSRQPVALFSFLLLVVLYGAVWVWCRPTRFVVASGGLDIVFPGWQRRIEIASTTHIRRINSETFRREFGWAIRIGVGGLWGGFGWLWTSQRGFIEFYISDAEDFVLIERSPGAPLLITPEHPQQFIEALQTLTLSR